MDSIPHHATLDAWAAAGHKVGEFTRSREGYVVIRCRYCGAHATRVHHEFLPPGSGFWRYVPAACAGEGHTR